MQTMNMKEQNNINWFITICVTESSLFIHISLGFFKLMLFNTCSESFVKPTLAFWEYSAVLNIYPLPSMVI